MLVFLETRIDNIRYNRDGRVLSVIETAHLSQISAFRDFELDGCMPYCRGTQIQSSRAAAKSGFSS